MLSNHGTAGDQRFFGDVGRALDSTGCDDRFLDFLGLLSERLFVEYAFDQTAKLLWSAAAKRRPKPIR